MAEFSKAIRHGVISLESLNDLDGVDRCKVSALADSVRLAHEEATAYIVSLIGSKLMLRHVDDSSPSGETETTPKPGFRLV